jgi:outer membrane protein
LCTAAAPLHATTLEEAIAAAKQHAPELEIAEAESDLAKAQLQQARSGGRPSAILSGSIGTGHLDPKGYFGLTADNLTPAAAQLVIEQPLFTGGKVSAVVAQARAGTMAAEAGLVAAESGLVANVAGAYGAVIAANSMVRHFARLVDETEEIERQARLRFGVGESPRTDVAQAQARTAEARAGLARAEGQLVSARARFRSLTGLDGTDLQPLPANPALPATLDDAIARAEANNPQLAQADAGVKAAQAGLKAEKAEQLPMVSAFAEGAMVRDQFFPGYKADSATVGVRARWQIFSGGRVSGKIAEGDARLRAAEAQRRAAQDAVREHVIAAFSGVRTATLVETAAQDQESAAREALRSVREEVRVGMKPQLVLLDAEREAIAASAALETARTERIVSAYRLLALIGPQ